MDLILKSVGRARIRLIVSRYRQLAVYHVAAGAAAATVAAWALRPPALQMFWMYGLAAGAALVAAATHAAFTRPSIRTAALALDRASGLRERLSTALLVRSAETPAERAVVDDAMRAASQADPGQIPLARVRRSWWPAVPPLVFLATLVIPSVTPDAARDDLLGADTSVAVPAPIRKEESAGLRRRAFDLEKTANDRNLPELRELAQAMRQISEDIRRSEMSQAEALSKLSRLEDKARERKKELASEAGLRDPQMRRSDGGQSSSAAEDTARKAEEFNQKLEELKAKLEKAKEELAKSSPGKNAELQSALAELARELDGLGAKDLGELGDKLEQLGADGDPEALKKMMEQLDGELEEMEGALEGMELLEGELEALQAMKGRFSGEGKDCLFCGKKGGG